MKVMKSDFVFNGHWDFHRQLLKNGAKVRDAKDNGTELRICYKLGQFERFEVHYNPMTISYRILWDITYGMKRETLAFLRMNHETKWEGGSKTASIEEGPSSKPK